MTYADFKTQEASKLTDLEKLVAGCKTSVSIEMNPHRGYRHTVEQHLEATIAAFSGKGTPAADVVARMIETDTSVQIWFSDRSGVCHLVFHYDLNAALAEAVRLLEKDR